MEIVFRLLLLISFLILVVAIPVWFVLFILKIILRNNPSQRISTAFKVVSLILLIDIPILFLVSLIGMPYLLSSMPMSAM